MNVWHLGLVVLTVSLLFGCHPQQRPVEKPPVAVAPPRGLFLYAVGTGPDRSYLMGTMHVGFGFEEVLTPEARRGFEGARKVMMEANVADAAPTRMMQAALLPPGQSLQALLGAPLWSQLVERVGQTIPPPVLDKLKPWMPAVLLGLEDMQRALNEARPGAAPHVMDAEVMQRAQRAGKQLLFLETIDEQLAVFTSIPESEQIRELSRALTEDNASLGRKMIEAYAAGDETALTASLFDEGQMQAAPGFYEAVLFQRNARWLPVIREHLKGGRLFVAVGAAHLFGSRGILAELRSRGYVVTRVGGS